MFWWNKLWPFSSHHGPRCWDKNAPSPILTWISFGNVALNISVCRVPVAGMVSFSTIRRICGSNPMSSMRSASSRTRNLKNRFIFITLQYNTFIFHHTTHGTRLFRLHVGIMQLSNLSRLSLKLPAGIINYVLNCSSHTWSWAVQSSAQFLLTWPGPCQLCLAQSCQQDGLVWRPKCDSHVSNLASELICPLHHKQHKPVHVICMQTTEKKLTVHYGSKLSSWPVSLDQTPTTPCHNSQPRFNMEIVSITYTESLMNETGKRLTSFFVSRPIS